MKTVPFVLPLLVVVLFYFTSGFALESFSSKILHNVALQTGKKNFVISPVSIEASLGLLFLGANGKTAEELQSALNLTIADKRDAGEVLERRIFRQLLTGGPLLEIATGIFVNHRYELAREFKQDATQSLRAVSEAVNFGDNKAAARRINAWVDQKTHHKIAQAIEPGSLDNLTAAVLVNSIYFKGEWLHSLKTVGSRQFHLNQKDTVNVEMVMNDQSHFEYGKLDDLDASGLLLPYDLSTIKMLIILPNSVDGLEALENKLQHIELSDIADQLEAASVEVFLPKFKIEYHTELNELLQQIGIETVFSSAADLSRMTVDRSDLYVSSATHDAVIQVSEKGTEAAAATEFELRPMFNHFENRFVANHPFFFAVIDDKAVYFAGHVVAP